MAKPDINTVLNEARRLHDDRFKKRNVLLQERERERFNETTVDVPAAYKKTSQQHSSNIVNDEGRQIATLVYSMPVPHLAPPSPEDQPLTTQVEQFLSAMHQELEDCYGPVWWQCTLAQTHDNIGWIYFAPKKVPYKGQPRPPEDDEDEDAKIAYGEKNERYKKDAGIKAVFDYEFANTATVLYDGNVYNPHCVYVWKEVPESTLRKTYGVYRDRNGEFSTNPTGYDPDTGKAESLVTIIEYWDAEWCLIIAKSTSKGWRGRETNKGAYVLQEWKHNFGRVPYFARPCFLTEQMDEDKKFAGPLDGLYNEMPEHKRLRTMGSSIAYQTAFAPLKIITKEQGETIVDDSGKPLEFLELEPGKARQLAPGQDVMPVGQSPEIANFYAEMAASQQRLERFSLPPVAKGISPGADTANAAISNLRLYNLSQLKPMSEQAAHQARMMYKFALEQIIRMKERVYVLNRERDGYLSLSGEEIPTTNVQAKAVPDQGQQQLLIEKHAAELKAAGLITLEQMYEMWGKENPEEYVLALRASQLFESLWPVILQQITADLGMLDAVKAMIQENAQSGSARNAVPGLMGQAQQMQEPSGMGQGSGGQPRMPGVRMPVQDVNTQRAMANGY